MVLGERPFKAFELYKKALFMVEFEEAEGRILLDPVGGTARNGLSRHLLGRNC